MAPIDRYRSPADLPAVIPVFPLRGAILLPRATLPLNIFEPRYLAMLDDVMCGHRVLGMIQPARLRSSEDEEEESPLSREHGLRRIGCAGRVTSYQELDDGRLIITLTGISRFEVMAEEANGKPYRSCKVDFSPFPVDFEPNAGEDAVNRTELMRVLKVYLETQRLRADWRSIAQAPLEPLINALCVMSPFGPEEKQALLEASDLKTRTDVLIALAEMELASGDGGGSTIQ